MPGYGPAVVGRMNRRVEDGRWWLRMAAGCRGKAVCREVENCIGRRRGCGVGNRLFT